METPYYGDGSQMHPQAPSSSGSNGAGGIGRQDAAAMERKKETRRRTKTGCLTCRKRRIKCDEGKPECLRCVKSKRLCEGYSSKTVFRNENQLHYQQNIRPSPVTQHSQGTTQPNGGHPGALPIQFSIPQYQPPAHDAASLYTPHNFATPHSQPYGINGNFTSIMPHANKGDPNSRNSSASNASGVSANSEQRRISVLSLMSSDKNGSPTLPDVTSAHSSSVATKLPHVIPRTAESDARDNYYYNYYVSCYAYTMARAAIGTCTENSSPEHPMILWPQIVPSLINEDPPGRRPLFDAIVAYTAHVRFEELPVDYEIRSVGTQAHLLELGVKAYIDITRGTSEILSKVETFFSSDDHLRVMFRWGLLQHTITHILADTKPRVSWVNYLGTKAFGSVAYKAVSDVEHFYLAALRHISSNGQQMPRSIHDLQHRYEFLSIPGMDIVYFAFTQDYESLRNIAYQILSHPRLEYLHTAYKMVNGARLRGELGLDMLANELMEASRQSQ